MMMSHGFHRPVGEYRVLSRLVAEQEVIGEQDQMDDYLKELQAKGERR
jgi:hypothetical protein